MPQNLLITSTMHNDIRFECCGFQEEAFLSNLLFPLCYIVLSSWRYSVIFRMDSRVTWNNIQLSARITIVSPIFQLRVVLGRHQINGKARGPTLQTAMIIKDFRKYHLIVSSLWCGREDASRNSPQCLHFIAAS